MEHMQLKALHFVFNDFTSNYAKFLKKFEQPSTSIQLIRSRVEEVYKCMNEIVPEYLELRRRHRNSILNRFLLKTSFHALLTFIYFCYLFDSLAFVSFVSWYRSCLVYSGLAYEIYSGSGPSMYVYCVVCYCVMLAPYVRSVGHVFAYLSTLDDDLECPMDVRLLYSLKFFLCTIITKHNIPYAQNGNNVWF